MGIDAAKVSVVSGADKVGEVYYITENTDLVLAPSVPAGTILLGVTAKVGADDIAVTRGTDGNYTIAGALLTGDVTLTYDTISGTIDFLTMESYAPGTDTSTQIFRVRMSERPDGSHLVWGTQELYWSAEYSAYVGTIASDKTEADIRTALTRATGAGDAVGYAGDVTGDGKTNVLDALAINAKLYSVTWRGGSTEKSIFEMDVNGDGRI